MLKVFAIEPKVIAIESGGDSITFDVSKCPQFQVGRQLFHTDQGATEHIADCISKMLANFGVAVDLPEIHMLANPSGATKGE